MRSNSEEWVDLQLFVVGEKYPCMGEKLKERWDTSTWKVEYPEEPPVPQQDNGAETAECSL